MDKALLTNATFQNLELRKGSCAYVQVPWKHRACHNELACQHLEPTLCPLSHYLKPLMQWRANLKLQQDELCKRQGSFSKVLISISDMPSCCDRGAADKMAAHCIKPLTAHKFWEVPEVDTELVDFWEKLDLKSRQALLTVDKKALFQRIRSQYCSRCFGLFVMRYDELKCSAQLDCPSEF